MLIAERPRSNSSNRRPSNQADLAAAGRSPRESVGGEHKSPFSEGATSPSLRLRRLSTDFAVSTRSIESLTRILADGQLDQPLSNSGDQVSSGSSSRRASITFVSQLRGMPRLTTSSPDLGTALRKSTSIDYRDNFQVVLHRMKTDRNDTTSELLRLKQRLLIPAPIRGRASLSILHYEHLRPVPPSALAIGRGGVHLNIVYGPPHEWVTGRKFNPGIKLAMLDDDNQPVYAWSARIQFRAYLLDGVGDIVFEFHDYNSAILAQTAYAVGNTVTFDNLRIMLPSSLAKLGYFRLCFVATDFAIEPVISDRFEIVETRGPRDDQFCPDEESEEAIFFSASIRDTSPSKKRHGGEASPMHVAIASGQTELIKLMIDRKDKINTPGPAGILPIHIAAYMGNIKMVNALLGAKANPSLKCDGGFNALHWAVLGGNSAAIEIILNSENPPDIWAETDQGFVATHLAARINAVRCIQIFPELRDQGTRAEMLTPAHIAAFHGYTEFLVALVKAGVDIDTTARQGWRVSHFAAIAGQTQLIDSLTDLGITLIDEPLEVTGFTPLHIAALRGHENIVKSLIKTGANPGKRAANGWTAAHMAAVSGDKDTLETIVAHAPELMNEEVNALKALFVFEGFAKTAAPKTASSENEVTQKLLSRILP